LAIRTGDDATTTAPRPSSPTTEYAPPADVVGDDERTIVRHRFHGGRHGIRSTTGANEIRASAHTDGAM
jgi:hypothetical protein